MTSHFLKLEWKQFFRSSSFSKSLGAKILIGFFGLYFTVCFLLIGIGGYWILKKQFPEQDPLVLVNSFLMYVVFGDLFFRYLMQKLPVMNIKPLLVLPIQKSKIVHFILMKSSFSFFNIMGLFFYVPFSIVLITQGYNLAGILGWLASMVLIIQSVNFFNFLVNKNNSVLIGLLLLLIFGYFIQYFNWFDLPGFIGMGFDAVYQSPMLSLLFLVVLIGLYGINYKQLRNEVYLDALISEQTKEINSADLSFLERLGDLAPFIKNDLRLIWRNKRTKSSVWMVAMGLLYGLFFYPNPMYAGMEFMYVLVGIFSTGTLLINFGPFILLITNSYLIGQNVLVTTFHPNSARWFSCSGK